MLFQRNSNEPSVGTVVAPKTGGVNSDEKQQKQQKTEAKRKPFLRTQGTHCHFSSFKNRKKGTEQRKKKNKERVREEEGALSPT